MSERKKVLVSGASGLLGSNIVRQLNKRGYKPVVFLRRNSNQQAIGGLQCEVIKGNLTSFDDLNRAVNGCEYVVHCAAKTDQKGKLSDFQMINTHATALLIQACKCHQVKKFVYISTANCFTNGTLTDPGNEASCFMPWLQHSGYAYSKYLAQEMVLHEANNNGFPAMVLAPTFLIGPGDVKVSSGKLIMPAMKNRLVFYTRGGKSFVNVEYAAEAVVNSLTMGRIGECYLLSGENLTYKEFYSLIREGFNPKAILIKLPELILVPIAFLLGCLQSLLSISLILNNTNRRLLCLENYFSNSKASHELGLKQTNILDTLRNAEKWYRTNGYL